MPLSLTRRGWGFALTAVGLGAAWTVIGLRDLWHLIALLAVLILLALVWVLVVPPLARLEVSVGVDDPTPTAGEVVTASAAVHRRLPVRADLRLVWEAEGVRVTTPIAGSRGGRTAPHGAVVRTRWAAAHRGPMTVRIVAVVVQDPLGLARRRIRRRDRADLLVLPRLLDGLAALLDEREGMRGSRSPASARTAGAGSGTPAGAVRAYRTGDALRQIHWKQSARQGELLVNLQEGPEGEERVLALVTATEAYATDEEFERAVSAAATLAVHELRRRGRVRLSLGERPAVSATTEAAILRALARVRRDEAGSTTAPGPFGLGPSRSGEEPPDAVATGGLPPRLRLALQELGAGGPPRLLLASRALNGSEIPAGWDTILLPAAGRDPAPSPLAGTRAGSSTAGVAPAAPGVAGPDPAGPDPTGSGTGGPRRIPHG